MLTYLQAAVIGVLQGITELFPVSSLGHSVLVPALIGGSWRQLATQSSTGASGTCPYLAFIVALHVATAFALIIYFRREWDRIVRALLASLRPSLRARRIVAEDADSRLAWLLVIGTIPVGITGLALEHTFRTLFAKPVAAAAFLTVNGLILLVGEALRRRAAARSSVRVPVSPAGQLTNTEPEAGRSLVSLQYREAGVIGLFQTFALLAGISRSGITMVGGLARGLNHEDAARFSFLLATPVILAAGVLKLPSLAGSDTAHIHGQILLGFLLAGASAYLAVRFLDRFFQTRTLTPFAIYSLVAGLFCLARFA